MIGKTLNVLGSILGRALSSINREDIVNACIFNVEPVADAKEKELAKQQLDQSASDSLKFDQSGYDSLKLDQSGFESLKDELGPSRDSSLRRNQMMGYGDQDVKVTII